MKIRTMIALAILVLAISCTESSCPTYGSHYTYSPPKKKLFQSSGKVKKVKKAEQ